jgi:hypothetical protein
MVRAHSLLYAIYICLIVALLCGALLYISGLYNRLNLFYSSHEQLYAHNESLINYVVGSGIQNNKPLPDNDEEISSSFSVRPYGLLSLIIAQSSVADDTLTSAHFAGYSPAENNMFVTNFGRALSYSGTVTINAKKQLPKDYLNGIYIENKLNDLKVNNPISISGPLLPEPNINFAKLDDLLNAKTVNFNDLEKRDSLYYNSFIKAPVKVIVKDHLLANINIKGNIIIASTDSIYISSSCRLEDVIIIAPKITFESKFEGTLQAFATDKLVLEKNVKLGYPSVVMMHCKKATDSEIVIKENSSIFGAIVLYGNSADDIRKNTILIEENSKIEADIYCTGNLICKSDINGSVYTNLLSYQTQSATYENCIADINVNPHKKTAYFISVPLLKQEKYETLKKLF